jgi:hypothetical protein
VDHLVTEGDLEGRPPSGLQIHAHPVREPVADRLPETSGPGEIPSKRAVLDRDHANSVVGRILEPISWRAVACNRSSAPAGRSRVRASGRDHEPHPERTSRAGPGPRSNASS